jgi:class 3 adenylate cyclase
MPVVDQSSPVTDVQQAVPVAQTEDELDGLVRTVADWIGFSSSCIKSGESWTPTCETMKVAAFKALDVVGNTALSRLTEPARKADRLGGDQEAIAREVLAQNLGPRLAAHVRKGGHGYITVANALDAIRAAFPDPIHTREGDGVDQLLDVLADRDNLILFNGTQADGYWEVRRGSLTGEVRGRGPTPKDALRAALHARGGA